MGKKYDAYEQAARAESEAKARYQQDPSPQNEAEARQAEINSNFLWGEVSEDPTG